MKFLKSKTITDYPLRYEAEKEKGVLFINDDLTLRGGKELAAYNSGDLIASISSFQKESFLLEINQNRTHWVNIINERFKSFKAAKEKMINIIKEVKQ